MKRRGMSENLKWRFKIKDILVAAEQIESSISDHDSASSLHEDWESFRAVERNIQIIAEAVKGIPPEVKEEYGKIAWQKIVNMRNFVVHQYNMVDDQLVWEAVREELPKVAEELKKILKRHG